MGVGRVRGSGEQWDVVESGSRGEHDRVGISVSITVMREWCHGGEVGGFFFWGKYDGGCCVSYDVERVGKGSFHGKKRQLATVEKEIVGS